MKRAQVPVLEDLVKKQVLAQDSDDRGELERRVELTQLSLTSI